MNESSKTCYILFMACDDSQLITKIFALNAYSVMFSLTTGRWDAAMTDAAYFFNNIT